MNKLLLVASSLAMLLFEKSICTSKSTEQPKSYTVSNDLYAALASAGNLSDTDETGKKFQIQTEYEGGETLTSYINPKGSALHLIGITLDEEIKPELRSLLDSYYKDNPAEKPEVPKEFNVPEGLAGIGHGSLLEIVSKMKNPQDIRKFLTVNKTTSALREDNRLKLAALPGMIQSL